MKTVKVKIIIRVSHIKLCKNMSRLCLVYVTRIIEIRASRVLLLLLSGIFTPQAVEPLWTSDQPVAETSA
jgi:hypothetical protein